MIARKTLNVSLTPELHDFSYGLVDGGTYGNTSEVVRAALRCSSEHERKPHRRREDGKVVGRSAGPSNS